MALSPYALVGLAELKKYVQANGAGADERLTTAINQASALIENRLSRALVTRLELTEFHTPSMNPAAARFDRLKLKQWPIISVESVHEDPGRDYAADSLLAVDVDYRVSKPSGYLQRISSGSPYRWYPGNRVVKVVYTGGWAPVEGAVDDDDVPDGARPIPDAVVAKAMKLAAMIYQEGDRKSWGQTTLQDALGNVTHVPGSLSRADWDELMGQADFDMAPTYEHDEWEEPA